MKKISDKTKNLLMLLGFSFLSVFIVLGVWILTREPSTEFAPMPEETGPITDTWEEKTKYSDILIAEDATISTTSTPTATAENQMPAEVTQESGNTEVTVSGTTDSLSDSTTREASDSVPPAEKPTTTDSLTDPNKKPEYDASIPLHTEIKDFKEPENNDTASVTSSGQVYDPVFGWIQTGDTHQNTVDSSGDINKQIGTMGN